ncbi:hypothetical protein EAJ14_21820 [Parabacteroides distasonis]|nr:hypothetical protein EAJ14_21820 [Parabacteroides distasonis]
MILVTCTIASFAAQKGAHNIAAQDISSLPTNSLIVDNASLMTPISSVSCLRYVTSTELEELPASKLYARLSPIMSLTCMLKRSMPSNILSIALLTYLVLFSIPTATPWPMNRPTSSRNKRDGE